jgi:poly [ADP-ribose] polymerase 6/8
MVVVTSNCLKKSGDIWVCTNAEHVVTRFFFVYDAPSYQGATSIHTNNKDFKNEITAAIQLTHKLRKL